MNAPTGAPLPVLQADPAVPNATKAAAGLVVSFGFRAALADGPGYGHDQDEWDKAHRGIGQVLADPAYAAFARRLLQAAADRLRAIQSGELAYTAERAFGASEVTDLELAAHVLLRVAEAETVPLVDRLLRDVATAPDPAAKTLPSQALFYALTRCVLDRPSAQLVLTLGELRGIVRHAGIKKKLVRIYTQAKRELDARPDAPHSVPDLGLAAGAGVFEVAGTRFEVDFDEALRPRLVDDRGRVRAGLPASAPEPDRARYTELKRAVRTVAGLEIDRLEHAMVAQASWSGDEFWDSMVRHPLAWHLVRRLVWESPEGLFRLAEDRTCADVSDRHIAVTGPIRLAHPLLMGPEAVHGWLAVFSDYEIVQPFPQLGREVYRAGDETACVGRSVATGAVIGLDRRGWSDDRSDRYGDRLTRRFDSGEAVLAIDPGIPVWDRMNSPRQVVVSLAWHDLSDVEISEVIRDVMRLGGAAE